MAAIESSPQPEPPLPYPWPAPPGDRLAQNPAYAWARENRPVCPVTLGGGEGYVATTYAAVQEIFRNVEAYSRALADAAPGTPSLIVRDNEGNAQGAMILAMDPADHRRVRGIVAKEFTPTAVLQWKHLVEEAVDDLLAELVASSTPADLVPFGVRLALGNIGRVIGIPPQDLAQFKQWGDEFLIANQISPDASLAALAKMRAYVGPLLEDRRKHPASDLLSLMAASEDATEEEKVLLAVAILTAGWETTACAIIGGIMRFLTTQLPHGTTVYTHLHHNPQDVPVAIEELLRTMPVSGDSLPRITTCPVALDGTELPEGALVFPSHDSANQDARVFKHPQEFRLDRSGPQHLAFGHGPHRCLGAEFARMELDVVFRKITQLLPGLSLVVPPEKVRWKESKIVHEPEELLVTW